MHMIEDGVFLLCRGNTTADINQCLFFGTVSFHVVLASIMKDWTSTIGDNDHFDPTTN